MNGAFSAGPDPGPVLLTDGQQMAFCVQRERERVRERKRETGDRKGKKKRKEEERQRKCVRACVWGGGLSGLFSLGPSMQV